MPDLERPLGYGDGHGPVTGVHVVVPERVQHSEVVGMAFKDLIENSDTHFLFARLDIGRAHAYPGIDVVRLRLQNLLVDPDRLGVLAALMIVVGQIRQRGLPAGDVTQ